MFCLCPAAAGAAGGLAGRGGEGWGAACLGAAGTRTCCGPGGTCAAEVAAGGCGQPAACDAAGETHVVLAASLAAASACALPAASPLTTNRPPANAATTATATRPHAAGWLRSRIARRSFDPGDDLGAGVTPPHPAPVAGQSWPVPIIPPNRHSPLPSGCSPQPHDRRAARPPIRLRLPGGATPPLPGSGR